MGVKPHSVRSGGGFTPTPPLPFARQKVAKNDSAARKFYRFNYNISAETIPDMQNGAFWCGSVRIVYVKKPGYSLLCAEATDELSNGQQLRVLRLRTGLTIREAAEMVGICRHTLMNYESGRTKVKAEVFMKLQHLYHTLLSSRK